MTRAPPTSLENSIMGLDGLQEKNDLGHHSDDKLPSSDAGREKPCPSGEGHSQSAGYTGSKERVTVDNIPPGRISSGAEPNRNSERDTHGTCPLGERLTNLGHFKEANKEVSITESARRDGQNFEGGCEVGEETRSPAIYEQEMLRRGCCSEVVEVQVSEDDENREDHTGTLRLRGSPAFSGVTSLTRARDCSSPIRKSDELESRISLSVLAELSALSGFLVSGSHAAKDIEMAEKSWKILAPWNWVQGVEFESSKRTQQQHVNQIGSSSSEALVLSLENKVPTQATSQDLFPFGGEAVQALLAHDEHEVNDFQKQPESHRQSGTPLTGIESTEGQISSISTKGGALFSLENNPLATIEPVRKPIGSCITASDLAEALKTAEIHVIISEIFKQLTPSWAVQTSLSSWLMQSLITQHREAGPVHVWASGSPKPNQGQQHESNEGTGNQNPEGNEDESLDEYLEYMDPDAIDPPEFVVSMLRNRGFPVPGDPGYKSWLEEYRKSRRLKPASQPEDLNPTDLGTFDDLDYLWGMPDPDLGFLEDLDMASPIRTTGNSKEPEGHAQSSADVGSLDLQDLGTQNAQNNPDDDSRNTNKLQYSEITNVDLEMRESYNKQILRWTRLLLAIKKRPTWWDQPDRGERLVGLIQELQRDSVQAFAQIDAAPGTRTPPNVELAQKLGQEFEQSSDVQGWYAAQEEDTEYFKRVMYGADEMDDLVEMRQILKRLDDMRRQPPQFQDAESHSQFASTIGTFYSVLIQTIERIYGEGAKDVLIDELLKFRDQFPDQSLNNVPSHQDFFNNFKDQGFQPFDTNINVDYYDTDDIELQETTLETRRRQRSQDTDTNQERAKKAARDTTKEAHPADTAAQLPHLQKV
ncbi:hypothetical protein R1sor_025557 [Riccia sorocarpa]|uniref:Uncharacterized protein n=1 Tax=Riccia sorocarpa TaxID=122646 RepID=A0ABD3GCV4_9MARC